VGWGLSVTVTKSGYKSGSDSFTACTAERTIQLEKEITYCDQPFKVIDKATGVAIPGVTIKLDQPPLTSCVTNSYGKCSITNLQVGWGLSVTVTKSGYKSGSDSFTACTAERTIQLEKEPTPTPVPCSMSTDKSEYEIGDVVTIAYANAPSPSWITATDPYGVEWLTKPVNGSGTEYWTIPTSAPVGSWTIALSDTGCSVSATITVTAIPPPGEVSLMCYDSTSIVDAPIELKATLLDLEGIGVSDATIEFTVSTSSSFTWGSSAITDSQGIAKKTISGWWLWFFEIGTYSGTSTFEGDATGSPASCSFTVSVLPTPVPPEDTTICDFDIRDADGSVVTDVVVGVEYKVRGYLCSYKTLLGIKYGGCAEILKGCDTDYEVSGRTLTFVILDGSPRTGVTDADGYVEIPWTPTEVEVGDPISVKLEFAGDAAYNASETDWKDVTVEELPYTINVTVLDENGSPIEGAYVDTDRCLSAVCTFLDWIEKKCSDVDVVVMKGECVTDEAFAGDGDNIKTAADGKATFKLPATGDIVYVGSKWGIRVGKPGYMNKDYKEDWTVRQETTPVVSGVPQGGTFNFTFTLNTITEEDKFIVTTGAPPSTPTALSLILCMEGKKFLWFWRVVVGGLIVSKDVPLDKKVEFTVADGLVEGKHYGLAATRAKQWYVPDFISTEIYEFRGIRKIFLPAHGAIAGATCPLFGMDADSAECDRFLMEMFDPIFLANVISGVLNGVDVVGEPYEPGKMELAMFPFIIVTSALPIPGAALIKRLGKIFRKADEVVDVAKHFEDDYLSIYRMQAYGDEARLSKWADAVEAGDTTTAKSIMDDILANHPDVTDAMVVDRFNIWLDDLEKQIGNIHPSQTDTILKQQDNVRKAADSIMGDVTDFSGVYDTKYSEFVDVARKGSEDVRVSTFVRATDDVCSPTFGACKYYMIAAKDKLHVGQAVIDMPEYTKFLYKHGATIPDHEQYIHSMRFLAVSDESDALALKALIEADDWFGFLSWSADVKKKFDWNYVGQVNFFDNEHLRILAQWSAERVDDIMGTSGFADEVSGMLDDLVENTVELKAVVDTEPVKAVKLVTLQEPDKAAKSFVKSHSASPESLFSETVGTVGVPVEIAEGLAHIPLRKVRTWLPGWVDSSAKYPHVLEYFKTNLFVKSNIVEAVANNATLKLDEFTDFIAKGDIASAQAKLSEAATGVPVGSVGRTDEILEGTERIADVESEFTRSALHGLGDEVAENTWSKAAKDVAEFKRIVHSPEYGSFVKVFRRGGRRILDRTSGGIRSLFKHDMEHAGKWGDLYSTTITEGTISEVYHMSPKGIRGWFYRNWKGTAVGAVGFTLIVLPMWWSVDNAVFIIWMGREFGWLEPGWGKAWFDAEENRETAYWRLKEDPCNKTHQRMYVDALEAWDALLEVDPVTEEQQESWLYYYKVAWAIEPSRPREVLLITSRNAFLSANDEYFHLVQHCPDPVEPRWGITLTELPEEFTAFKVDAVLDGDTIDIIPPDELPTGEELYWEHSIQTEIYTSPIIRVRIAGINALENSTYDYHNQVRPFMVRRRALGGPGTEHPECTLVGDGTEHPECEDQWYAVPATFDAYKAVYNEILTWMVDKVGGYPVTLKSDLARQYDKYRRYLAVVDKAGEDIGKTELGIGYAVVFFYDANNKVNTTIYSTAENEAIEDNIGVWPLREMVCTCDFGESTYVIDSEAILRYNNAPTNSVLNLTDPDDSTADTWIVTGSDYVMRRLDKVGTWRLTLTGVDCSDEDTAIVSEEVCPAVSADFSVSPSSTVEVGEVISFLDNSTGGVIVKWFWNFADGNTSALQNPTHVYDTPGKYTVKLTAWNDCDNWDDVTMEITVKVPTTPTPPPPPEGILTIHAYESDCVTTHSVSAFIIDDIDQAGGVSLTEFKLTPGTHKIGIRDYVFTEYYVVELDEYFDTIPGFFNVNVPAAPPVTVINVCMVHRRVVSFTSVPFGATVSIRPAGTVEWIEITPPVELVVDDSYEVKYELGGYELLSGVITVHDTYVSCDNVTTPGGSCDSTAPPAIDIIFFEVVGYLRAISTPTPTPIPGEKIAEDNETITIPAD